MRNTPGASVGMRRGHRDNGVNRCLYVGFGSEQILAAEGASCGWNSGNSINSYRLYRPLLHDLTRRKACEIR